MRSKGTLKGLTRLGGAAVYERAYAPELLECFDNNFPKRDFWARFTCPEFQTINPATGEPYGATILIQYIPWKSLVESKSLKLYMFSFRYSTLKKDIGKLIVDDLVTLLKPKYLEVEVRCAPREGLKARTFANYAKPRSRYVTMAKARLAAFRASLRAAPKMEELPEERITLNV